MGSLHIFLGPSFVRSETSEVSFLGHSEIYAVISIIFIFCAPDKFVAKFSRFVIYFYFLS